MKWRMVKKNIKLHPFPLPNKLLNCNRHVPLCFTWSTLTKWEAINLAKMHLQWCQCVKFLLEVCERDVIMRPLISNLNRGIISPLPWVMTEDRQRLFTNLKHHIHTYIYIYIYSRLVNFSFLYNVCCLDL